MRRNIFADVSGLAEDDFETLKRIALDPDTDERTLRKLAAIGNGWIRTYVAKNPSTPPELAEQLKEAGLMVEYAIVVETCDDNWYWSNGDWKDYVCPDFNEHVVIPETRDTYGIEEAQWWTHAVNCISDMDDVYDLEEFKEYCHNKYTDEQMDHLWAMYQNCRYSDDPDFIADVAMYLTPGLQLNVTGLHGSGQGDYVTAVYDTAYLTDTEILEDWYWGNIYEITPWAINDESMTEDDVTIDDLDIGNISSYAESEGATPITSTEYFRMYGHARGDALLKGLAEYIGVPAEDSILIDTI